MKSASQCIFLTILFQALLIAGHGQNTFQKLYGGYDFEESIDLVKTHDENYMVLGHTESFGNGRYDLFLSKISQNGKVLWSKSYGTSSNEKGLQLLACKDGGFILLGQSNASFPPYQCLIVKTNGNGDVQWSKLYMRTGSPTTPRSINETRDGGYLICGEDAATRVLLFKINSIGNITWEKQYSPAGGGFHFAKEIKSKNILLYGGQNPFVILLDSIGNLIKSKIICNSCGALGSNCGLELENGNFVFGLQTPSATLSSIRLVFVDTLFNPYKMIVCDGVLKDIIFSMSKTRDQGILISGYTESIGAGSGAAFIMKFDNAGNSEWLNFLGSGAIAYAIQEAFDDGYIFTGSTTSLCGLSRSDAYLVKTDHDGLNDCLGYYGALRRLDDVPVGDSIVFTPIAPAVALRDSSLSNIAHNITLFESTLCQKLEIERAFTYPNPFRDETTLRIQFQDQDNICPSYIRTKGMTLNIYNMLGELLRTSPVENNYTNLTDRIEINIPRNTLTSGMYIWELNDFNNIKLEVGKFIAY